MHRLGVPAFAYRIANVIHLGADEHVIWIAAGRHIACMADNKPFRDWAFVVLVQNPMHFALFSVPENVPISKNQASSPKPASAV